MPKKTKILNKPNVQKNINIVFDECREEKFLKSVLFYKMFYSGIVFLLTGFFVVDFAFGLITYRAKHFCPFFCCVPKKGTKKKRGTAKKTRAAGALPRSFCGRGCGLGFGGGEREGFWYG